MFIDESERPLVDLNDPLYKLIRSVEALEAQVSKLNRQMLKSKRSIFESKPPIDVSIDSFDISKRLIVTLGGPILAPAIAVAALITATRVRLRFFGAILQGLAGVAACGKFSDFLI
jgi:hypothetical protein